MKRFSVMALTLIIALVFTACTSKSADVSSTNTPAPASAAAPGEASQLVVAMDQEPVGLDPHVVTAAASRRIFSLIYDTLTVMDGDLNIQPGLADKWTYSPDGKTLTFDLHKGVKWQNGREFTSDDVKYTFDRILNPNTGAFTKSSFESIESMETPDKNTIVFKLKKPDSVFLVNASSVFSSIVPKEVTDLNKEAMGTGPFILEKAAAGQYVQLKKNPNYFKTGLPKVDSVKFQLMKDESEKLAALRAGKIDLGVISNDSTQLLANAKGVKVVSITSGIYSWLGLNTAKKPLDNPKVREAMSYAIDRNEIAKTVLKGHGEPSGPFSPAIKNSAVNVSEYPTYTRNVEKAKQLMKEAGLENGFEVTIDTMGAYPEFVDTAQVLQQQLKEIGIKVNVNKLEQAAFVSKNKAKDFQMMLASNSSATSPDRALRFLFSTTGTGNVWNYSNKEFDDLVQKAAETTDDAQRKELYTKAQKILVADAPNLFLVSPKLSYAVSDRVQGFAPKVIGENFDAVVNVALTGK